MASLLDLSEKLKKLYSGFKQGAEDVFVDPLKRTTGNIATAATVIPQAYGSAAVSRFNPQLGAQLASRDIAGTQSRAIKIAQDPQQALKTQLFDTAKLGLSSAGLGSGARALGSTALIGGGISAIAAPQGQRLESFGRGVGSSPLYAGMGVASQRVTTPLVSKFAPGIANKSGIAPRLGQAAFNIGENVGLDLATGQGARAFSPENIAFSGLTGFAGQPFRANTAIGKGFDIGRNTNTKWDKRDIDLLDSLRDTFNQNRRKLNQTDIDNIEDQTKRLARGYLSNAQIQKITDRYGSNIKGAIKETLDVLAKTATKAQDAGKVIDDNKFTIDQIKMGIVGDSTKGTQTPQLNKQMGTLGQPANELRLKTGLKAPQVELPEVQTRGTDLKQTLQDSSEDIISEAKTKIGSQIQNERKPIKESVSKAFDDFYTQWVDRYNPLVKASSTAKQTLKKQGAELRPEYDPQYLVRRLTGAGGIANARFEKELKPIFKQVDDLKIEKADLDVYLANKRLAGFGDIGREIYGADPVKAKQVVNALESKYGNQISDIANQLYKYQDQGLDEMVQAGFISKEAAQQMRQQNPDYAPLQRVMDEVNDYIGLPTRKTMQGSQPIQKIKGSERNIVSPLESIITNTFSQRAAIEKNRVAQSVVDLQKIAPELGFTKASKSGPDTITVWNNGQKEYWKVGTDIADVAKGVNEEAMNLVLKIFQAPASLLRQGATGRNPEFMIPNVIRDQLDAGVSSKYGYIPFVDYVSGLKSILTNDDVYKKWEASGAKIDLGEMSGKKSIQQYVSDTKPRKNLITWLGKGLDVLGKYSEQPTRVGLFKKAYGKTGNELLSVMESRDATVDFARMGSKMKVANSIIPFLNVGVQGFDKLIRATKNNPAKVSLMMGLYAAAPQVASTVYNLTNFPEEYNEIPDYEKESNFILISGRNPDGTVNYVTMPKGNIVPVVANPVQSFLEYAYNNDEASFKEMALSTTSNTLPVIGSGSSLKEIATKTVGQNVPQAIKPVTENLLNKSFWKYDPDKEQTKEIVPSYLQKKAPYQQSYEWTPRLYKAIGAVTDTSPLQVQNLMEGYLAGYSKLPAQLIDVAVKLNKGEEISNNDKTILRRFIKTTYPGSSKKPTEKAESPGLMERVTGEVSAANELPNNPNDVKVLYEDAIRIVNNYPDTASKIRTGLKDSQTLPEAQEELVQAKRTLKILEEQQPEVLYKIKLEDNASGGGQDVESRSQWVFDELSKVTDKTELDKKVQEMLDANVLTKQVVEQVRELGLPIDKYVSGGKVKTYGGSGSTKKIKLSPLTYNAGSKLYKPQSTRIAPPPRSNIKISPQSINLSKIVGNQAPQQVKPRSFKNTLTEGTIRLV